MAKKKLADLAPATLGRLVAGMTTREVEAVIGPYLRPNLYEGRRFYAWICEGAMLRASFEGPGATLSKAVLDVAEEHRLLDLCGDVRRRIKNCTINRLWNCVRCRKQYRQSAVPSFVCPSCNEACEYVLGIRVPTPKRIKAWDDFWNQYHAESAMLDAYCRGEYRANVKLELFGIKLKGEKLIAGRRRRTKRERKMARHDGDA